MIPTGDSNTQFHPNPDPVLRLPASGQKPVSSLLSVSYTARSGHGYCVAKTQFRRRADAISRLPGEKVA